MIPAEKKIVEFVSNGVKLRFGNVVCNCYRDESKVLCIGCLNDVNNMIDRLCFENVSEFKIIS